jgi:Fur family zinc uptake transcriptional regulator
MKAYELLECLREEGINAPMTVYRALGRLAERGLVRKIESLNAYYALPSGAEGGCAAFLICRHCEALGYREIGTGEVARLTGDLDVSDAYIELRTDCLSGLALLSGSCGKS